MANGFITIVSGLPRSGTSLMMQMLHAGGLPVLTDGLRVADDSNQRGYFEYEPVKRLRTDRSWLPQAVGQAVKIIHLLLTHLQVDGSLRYRIVFMQRPVEEVIESQRVMLARDGKPAADAATLKKVFEGQLAQIASWLAAQPSIEVMYLPYHRVVREPAAVAAALKEFLGLDLDEQAMAATVDPTLHRQRLQP